MRVLPLVLFLAMFVACSSAPPPKPPPPPPPPTTVDGKLQATPDVNPSVTGRPSPIALRLYELKSADAFSRADFMSLYTGDIAALGADLVAREEVTLRPDETQPFKKSLHPDTRFIGVFAAYRDVERSRWRAAAPVQPGKAHQLSIRAESLTVSIGP